MDGGIEGILKKSKELYDEMKEFLRIADLNDGAFIQMCYAITKWEYMDYYLEEVREAIKEGDTNENTQD